MSDTIQADYEQLEAIAGSFGKEADDITTTTARVRQSYQALKNGGWIGRGADAFFTEMDSEILPALQRFFNALEKGQSVTQQIIGDIRQTEEEAANLFKGEGAAATGGAGASAGAGAGGATGAAAGGAGGGGTNEAGGASSFAGAEGGASSGAGGTASGSGSDFSAEKDLAKGGIEAAKTARKVVSAVKGLEGAERIKALSDSLGFKLSGGGLSAASAVLSALDKDVSTPAVAIDGVARGALSFFGLDPSKSSAIGGKVGITSAVVGIVHGVTSAISPEAGKYTAIANDAMPDQVAGKLVSNAVHTYDALFRGDTERVIQQQERLLKGEYGEVLRGYAIGTETIGALVTGDDDALNKISQAAGSGKLGPLAEFGDWLGGEIYDIVN